ncbi:MAG TPA: acyltransferase [Ignavibacteriaceae bacterium]|nr:acyltransferase [Ignavibacteriaceae bacterium]
METPVQVHETVIDSLKDKSQSGFRKYQEIYVGKNSFPALIKYEILTMFLSSLPGAIGFALRKVFLRKLLGTCGRGAVLGQGITLRCPGQIFIGDNFTSDSYVVLDAKGKESLIELGDSIFIGRNSIFSCASSSIKVGNNVSIGPGCYIRASRGPVKLGSDITIGAHTVIISGNPDYKRLDIPMMNQDGQAKGINIGNDVWMGVGVKIIDGVKVGNGCVIGAGAVVTKDIPDFSIAAGVPAKVISSRKINS